MGYRNYLYKIKKKDVNKIRNMTLEQLNRKYGEETIYLNDEEIKRIIKSFNEEQSKLFYIFVNGCGKYQERISNTIEFCHNLLSNKQVTINGKTYYKHECDDEITGYIMQILQGKVNIKKDVIKDKEV